MIEAAALAAAEMKDMGLGLSEYLELPPLIVMTEDMPEAYLEKPVPHVEFLAECAGCSRPLVCVGQVIGDRIELHDISDHLPPREDDCLDDPPLRMSAYRRLIFRPRGAAAN